MAIRTALVVDDSRLARLTLTKLLEKRDIRVTQASSAREAMESLQEGRPDVIMMDVTMPDTDGFEATRQITENPDTSAIPVVMCTAEDTNEARDRAHACGAHGFLTKPASEENITDVLHRLAEQLEASEPIVLDPNNAAVVVDAAPLALDGNEIDSRARTAAEAVLREQGGDIFTGLMTEVARKVFESMVPANDAKPDKAISDDFVDEVRAQVVESATAAASDAARQVAREEADVAARSAVESSQAEADQSARQREAELRAEVDERIDGLLNGDEFAERIDRMVKAELETSGIIREEIVEEARQEVSVAVQRETSQIAERIDSGIDPSDVEAARAEARKALSTARKVLVVSLLACATAIGVAIYL